MAANKIIRTICFFHRTPEKKVVARLDALAAKLTQAGYVVQTKRLCCATKDITQLDHAITDKDLLLSVGTLRSHEAEEQLQRFYAARNVSFNVDLTHAAITAHHTKMLFDIMRHQPEKTFNFTYVFNNPPSSPYFPAANYHQEGFAIGLQPTDLAAGCDTLDGWLLHMRDVWYELHTLLQDEPDFLGIDSSVAPLFTGNSSLIHFIKRLGMSFAQSVTTDVYLTITRYLKQQNPRPVGLCGLMFPCLEDFELAELYEQGQFAIERNVFLALHSGVGIDTYPIGIDESPETVVHILRLLQGLSNAYGKALSARFVSDGAARVGERTHFANPYLRDVVVRPLGV